MNQTKKRIKLWTSLAILGILLLTAVSAVMLTNGTRNTHIANACVDNTYCTKVHSTNIFVTQETFVFECFESEIIQYCDYYLEYNRSSDEYLDDYQGIEPNLISVPVRVSGTLRWTTPCGSVLPLRHIRVGTHIGGSSLNFYTNENGFFLPISELF